MTKEIAPIIKQGSKVTIEKYVKTMGNGVEEAVDLTTEILFQL